MRSPQLGSMTLYRLTRRLGVGMIVVSMTLPSSAVLAQTRPAPSPPTATSPAAPPAGARPTANRPADVGASGSLTGRRIEDVRVVGNTEVPTAIILNLVRSRVGERFDPATAQEDYQRIYGLRKFSNVEAKVEPTATGGVIVVFTVSEQRQIRDIRIQGNANIDEFSIRQAIDVKPGEAIDRFRISLSKQAIENLYKDKNYPFAHVDFDSEQLGKTGTLVFNVVEGPNVRVRKVNFRGNHSFSDDRLKDQIQTRHWIWIFRPGTYDASQIDDDVASVRKYYQQKGFFDARVGRKIIFSPDLSEVQVDFVVEEGVRYVVDKITFKGNASVGEAELRKDLKLVEGQPFDNEVLQRDIRQVVRAYSPYGFIYQPGSLDPDYLRIGNSRSPFGVDTVFRREAGRVELVYNVSEGKPFRMGRIIVKGNTKVQDKVILREMRVRPGQLYNAGELQDATDRIRAVPGLFTSVNISPTGDDPETRDILVEVKEGSSANLSVGAGINSNGGVGGNLTYEQKNFDITNWPRSWGELFSDKAFTGAGQTLRLSFEPGTSQTNASIRFFDPYVFDQPYGFGAEAYLRNRVRENYTDQRLGGRLSLDKRFDYVYSARLSLRAENVDIHDIEDKEIRAVEILEAEGNSVLTSIGISGRRDTTNRGLVPYRGTTTSLGWESFGLLGGDYNFQRFTAGFDYYKTISEDLLDRKTIFGLHFDAGYITGDDPFFERFYGGGIGSIRGFAYRGVSPRSGPDDDRIGGDFSLTGTAEISFPLYAESLRGVVFTDFGTVEPSVEIGTIRTSIGAGVRLTLPFLGQVPIAIDLAIPITKDDEDDTQIISFSLGFQN
ncbi:MAG: BamA/TamA family outer membrane protein [Anaerolineae bacterium]|nr:BamA/TamA family outer membrane protein [Phycisphaerae bacterium]